jgi:phage terminase large subunit-like protein
MRSSQVSPPPTYASPATDRPTYGPALAAVGEALGIELMPWQRHVADVALERDDRGRLAYREVIVSVPRQSGKSTLLLLLLLWRLLSAPGQRAIYAAQNRLSARNRLFDTWYPKIRRSPLRDTFTLGRATGAEALRAANGSLLTLLSSEESGGHGEVLDLAVLDEAWALTAAAEQSTRPAMATRRGAQVWCVSTAGTERSVFWRSKVDAGRAAAGAGLTEGTAFFEWSMPPDASDIGDPELWRSYHPALNRTIEERVLSQDLGSMDPHEFRRAYGNVWSSEALTGWRVIGKDDWEANRW